MGDITPSRAPADAADMDAEVSAGVPPVVGGSGGGAKRKRTVNETREVLKKLLKASGMDVVYDLNVALSFTMDGLTYQCNLPIARPPSTGAGANGAFPDLTSLLEGSRGNKFVDLLRQVVRKARQLVRRAQRNEPTASPGLQPSRPPARASCGTRPAAPLRTPVRLHR